MYRFLLRIFSALLAVAAVPQFGPSSVVADASHPASHAAAAQPRVSFGGREMPFTIMAAFVLPGDRVPVEVAGDSGTRVVAQAGSLVMTAGGRSVWQAPLEPGGYAVQVLDPAGVVRATINAFVLEPYGRLRRGSLAGYPIGAYPRPRSIKGAQYPRPLGFVPVTAATESMRVAPHFQLAQFVCKAGAGFPKFVVLEPDLIVKLERLLARVNEAGIAATTFQVMSGYRTPRYNRAIGNVTTYSRHEYGDAADIYVDQDLDGRMDDLNHDGREDRADATLLRQWAQELETAGDNGVVAGGLSDYDATERHGPFVHVDARGRPTRW